MTEAELDATEDKTVLQMQHLVDMSHDKLNNLQWAGLYRLTIGPTGALNDKKLDALTHIDPATKSRLKEIRATLKGIVARRTGNPALISQENVQAFRDVIWDQFREVAQEAVKQEMSSDKGATDQAMVGAEQQEYLEDPVDAAPKPPAAAGHAQIPPTLTKS